MHKWVNMPLIPYGTRKEYVNVYTIPAGSTSVDITSHVISLGNTIYKIGYTLYYT